MIESKLLEDLRESDFSHDPILRDMYQMIGRDAMVKLIEHFSGINFYIPKNALDTYKRRMIIKLRKEYSPKEIARSLHLTEAHVYNVLREAGHGKREQLSFFEAPGDRRSADKPSGKK